MPRPGCGVELTTRSDGADLPPGLIPAGTRALPKAVELLRGEAELDTWRIVEVFSRTGLPFEVDLSWSAGSGSGAQALVTVSRSARICVFARSLRVAALNLADKVNRVGVTVGDGFAVTRNQWEHRGAASLGSPIDVPIPPFAEMFRVEMANLAAAPLTLIEIVDGLGTTRAAFSAAAQPPAGIGVGGASAVHVSSTSSLNANLRTVFHLSL